MVETYRNKFNKKYGFPKNASHSKDEISKLTGYERKGLDTIFDKGVGAFYTNNSAVRKSVKSPEQWAYSRLYSSVMGGKASKIDKKHLNFV